MQDFFQRLWEKPIHMLIVVCVLLSIITMIYRFVTVTVMGRERYCSGPVRRVAQQLRNENRY